MQLSFFTWREIPCEPVGKVPTTSLGKNSGMGFRSEEIVRRELEKIIVMPFFISAASPLFLLRFVSYQIDDMKVKCRGTSPSGIWKYGFKIFVDQKIFHENYPWFRWHLLTPPTPTAVLKKNQGRDASQTSKPMDSHMVFNLPALSPFTADSNILPKGIFPRRNSGSMITSRHRFRIFRTKKKSPSCHPKKQKSRCKTAQRKKKKKTIKKSSRRTVSKNFPPGQGTCKWGRLFLLYQCCETWVVVSITEWSGWSGHWRIWVFNWEPWLFLEHVWKVSLVVWRSILNTIPKSDSYLSPVCICMVLNKLGMNQWIM